MEDWLKRIIKPVEYKGKYIVSDFAPSTSNWWQAITYIPGLGSMAGLQYVLTNPETGERLRVDNGEATVTPAGFAQPRPSAEQAAANRRKYDEAAAEQEAAEAAEAEAERQRLSVALDYARKIAYYRNWTPEQIADLQAKLIKLGYNVGNTGADGKMGRNTLNAIKQFQKDYKLTADGLAGANTMKVFDKMIPMERMSAPITGISIQPIVQPARIGTAPTAEPSTNLYLNEEGIEVAYRNGGKINYGKFYR